MEFYKNVIFDKNKVLATIQKGDETLYQKIRYQPRIFIPTNESSEYSAFGVDSMNVAEIRFDDVFDQFRFIKAHKDSSRFYGTKNSTVDWISQNYPGQMQYDDKLINICYMDIEVGSQNGFPSPKEVNDEVQLITITDKDKFICFGLGEFTTQDPDVEYIQCESEEILLKKFIKMFRSLKYDVITGWFIREFDIPYLVRRIDRVLGTGASKLLSPWKKIDHVEITSRTGQSIDTFDIWGISTLDYIELYKKYGGTNVENYKLNTIAYVELGEKKLDHSQYKSLHDLYLHNFQLYTEYNIQDVKLVKKLEEKKQLLALVFNLAYSSKVNYIDTFKQTVMWDSIIYNYLLNNKQVPAIKTDNFQKTEKFRAAFVKEPKDFKADWVVSLDATSMYPHIIMGWNISPETYQGKLAEDFDNLLEGNNKYLDQIVKNNQAMCANGALFSKNEKGVLNIIIEELFAERAKYKDLMLQEKRKKDSDSFIVAKYDVLQSVKKVCLNSSFGALGNAGFRFFSVDIAEGITITARLVLKYAESQINKYLNKVFKTENVEYVIYYDTDSVYVKLETLLEKMKKTDVPREEKVDILDKFAKNILQPLLDKHFNDLAKFTNAYSQKIFFKRESIANRGIWIAKKKYVLSVLDKEGKKYDPPEIMITGIEAIKSDTPEICRNALKDCLRIVMEKSESDLHSYVSSFKEKFKKEKFEDISFPSGVNGLHKYSSSKDIYKKGTPINTRASLLFNHYIKERKLDNKYKMINNGEKIRFCYLKLPNPIHENVIAITDDLPPELGLEKFIDYDLQFEKAFISPLESIISTLNWNKQEQSTLEAIFA